MCLCISQYGLDRILGEEKSLALLARAIDPTQSAMMTDVVKLLSAICIVGEENTYAQASFFLSKPLGLTASLMLKDNIVKLSLSLGLISNYSPTEYH